MIGKIVNLKELGAKEASGLAPHCKTNMVPLELVWFKGIQWIKDSLEANTEYIVFGKPNLFNGKINIAHPEIDLFTSQSRLNHDKLQPVYPSTEELSKKGFSNKAVAKLTKTLVQQLKHSIPETLSNKLITKLNLLARNEAFENIHFPKNTESLQRAQYRLKFEELFFIQLQLIRRKSFVKKTQGVSTLKCWRHFQQFFHHHLPFDLTNAQKRVLKEIRQDCGKEAQMNRLLQGDVVAENTSSPNEYASGHRQWLSNMPYGAN